MPLFAKSRALGATKTTRRLFRGPARGQALRPAGDRYQHACSVKAARRFLCILDRDRIDEAAATLDVVDAEIVELDLSELRGNLARSIERERIRALEEGLRGRKLVGGRAILGHPLDFLLDDRKRVRRRIGTRGRAAENDRRAAEPDEAVGHTVGEAALLAHLFVEPRGKTAAAQDMV